MAHTRMFSYYKLPISWLTLAWKSLTGVQSRHGVPPICNNDTNDPYVLVGSNVWLLVKQKFGYDMEIAEPVTYDATRNPRWWFGTMPFTGRIPYETYLRDGVISEDDDDDDTELEDVRVC